MVNGNWGRDKWGVISFAAFKRGVVVTGMAFGALGVGFTFILTGGLVFLSPSWSLVIMVLEMHA